MLQCSQRRSLVLCALAVLVPLATALNQRHIYPYGHEGYRYDIPSESGADRQGRIFNTQIWQHVDRGLQDTADVISRMAENLEVTFGQISDNLGDNFSNLADAIEERVENSVPPNLRHSSSEKDVSKVEAIEGTLGGVDGGLKIYYKQDEGDTAPDSNEMKKPKPVSFTIPNMRTPFSNLFQYGRPGGLFNLLNIRKPWYEGPNICVDREEIDESESSTTDEDEAEAEAEAETIAEAEREAEAKEVDPGLEVEAEVETDKIATQSTPTNYKQAITTNTKPTNLFSFVSSFQMSSCVDSGDKYTCVSTSRQRGIHKTRKITKRCCHGFVKEGNGCTKVDLHPMTETLSKLDATQDFLSLIEAAQLVNTLNDNNVTVFVPNSDAILDYTADLEEQNEITNDIVGLRRRESQTPKMTPMLLNHIVDGFVYAADFKDEQIILSLNETPLRTNTYSNQVTINCARITKANQHSSNGVVHIIDRVLKPVQQSISQIINTDHQFTILRELMGKTEFLETLDSEGEFTLLAPTDAAFRRLEPEALDSLLDGRTCLDAVLKQHILPNTICASAIQGKMKTINLLDEYLVVERDEDERLTVDEADIVTKDIVATNGVLHIIDKALIPNQAKSLSDLLDFHKFSRFKELLEDAEMVEELNTMNGITVFAPANAAIDNIPKDELEELKANKVLLRRRLRYHITNPSFEARNVANNHIATTQADVPLRINLYSKIPMFATILGGVKLPIQMTAGCERVTLLESRACGANLHLVDGLIALPKTNVLEVLDHPDYSMFRQMVLDAGMEEELTKEGPYTVIAPSDHALRTIPEEELKQISEDSDLLKEIVGRHVLNEHVCCSGIYAENWLNQSRRRTLAGQEISLRKTSNGRLVAGPARIIKCGTVTGNGIVHTVDKLAIDDREIVRMLRGDEAVVRRRTNIPNIFFF